MYYNSLNWSNLFFHIMLDVINYDKSPLAAILLLYILIIYIPNVVQT